eukprot:3950063-Pyramimonas_sp.AAC.1
MSKAVLGSSAAEHAPHATLHAVAGVPAIAERPEAGHPNARRHQMRQPAEGAGCSLQAATWKQWDT